MALVKCTECDKEISAAAKTCPNCGFKARRTSLFTWLVTIFIGIPIFIGMFGRLTGGTNETAKAETSEQAAIRKKKDAAVQRATDGAVTLKKAMRNPDSFKLESAFVIDSTYAVCYEYRAQNGFGGVNAGRAVLSADGKRFKISTMDGFAILWNKECANKTGTETAASIRWLAL